MKKKTAKNSSEPKESCFPTEYFAGLLSKNGFNNFLPEYTKKVNNYYIIKGTPGSGKSTLMKKIAHAAEASGRSVELIRCSSDPFSLDGVIVPSLSFAMVDGTAPHVTEPMYPVARETVINTADYIDSEKVLSKKEEVINATNEKKRLFESGEKLLKCACILESAITSLAKESYDEEKIKRFCEKVIEEEMAFGGSERAIQKNASLVAFGKIGFKTLFDTLKVNKMYKINRLFSSKVLSELKNQATESQVTAVFSPSPFDVQEICAIYFCDSGTLFVDSRFAPLLPDFEKVKIPSFEKAKWVNEHKEKIKFLKKTQSLILKECENTLAEGMTFHAKLEEIYSSALNKNALDCLAQSLIISLF